MKNVDLKPFMKIISDITQPLLMVVMLLILVLGLLIIKRKFPQLIDRILSANEFGFKVSPISFEAKITGKIEEAIDFEFTENLVKKTEIKELIAHELKTLIAEIRRETTGVNLRLNQRVIVTEVISIKRDSGKVIGINTLNQSTNGLRFSCKFKLKRKEIIRTDKVATIDQFPFPLPEWLVIVSGEEGLNGNYVYGAVRKLRA